MSSKNYKFIVVIIVNKFIILYFLVTTFMLAVCIVAFKKFIWNMTVSLNSIRNHSHLKNEYNFCILKLILKLLWIEILLDSSKFEDINKFEDIDNKFQEIQC